ncbi:hypothetical protein OSL57_27390, partial [Escherichia coli]|nr:hypothetical protein [Escherichia coli]
ERARVAYGANGKVARAARHEQRGEHVHGHYADDDFADKQRARHRGVEYRGHRPSRGTRHQQAQARG